LDENGNARAPRRRRQRARHAILAGVAALPETGPAPSRELVARAAIALVALLLAAWFVVLARNHWIGTTTADRIVNAGGMSTADWRAAERDFGRAHLLDPSSDWSIVEAQYQLLYDKHAASLGAERILRHEPDNLAAWWVLLRATQGRDDARYKRAAAAVRRLNPMPASAPPTGG
jgi:hypothetical protein